MARVRSLAQGNQTIRQHDSDVDCFYNVLLQPDGSRLLHLSTFGSDSRQSKPKSSQSIQIDERIAVDLMRLLRATFPSVSQ
jgi:hypothetical protein